jgi:hypothetical protein
MEKNFNWPSNWDPFVICEVSFGVKLVQSPLWESGNIVVELLDQAN